ncbi:MAG TPA: hypothetical protein VFT74_19900 [Isosphaeraceae bacterium]|nr:hypothetical protein [Isosphaeraceae bacterium]
MPQLLPQSFWFRLAFACPRNDSVPNPKKGPLLNLSDVHRLPETPRLDGLTPWFEARAAWNPSGLAFAFTLRDKPGRLDFDPDLPDASDGVQLWIDTRDTRDIHRASKFCHRFDFRLQPGRGSALDVDVSNPPIARAQGNPPGIKTGRIQTQAETRKDGWSLEVFLPSEALHGFDPETNRRLGVNFAVLDTFRGAQFLSVGRDFPTGEDPSLWSTLELVDSLSK